MDKKIPTEELMLTDKLSLQRDYILAPFAKPTPPEKVQRREDGYDYVEGSYMDYQFKQDHPSYRTKLISLEVKAELGWIFATVELTDGTTGNSEIGAGAARIQVSKEAKAKGNITPFDIIDLDKNAKSALTNAIKNAQSRFGTCADVYNRRESILTEEERSRFESAILNVPAAKRSLVREAFKKLKFDYADFIDKLESRYPASEKQESEITTPTKTKLKTNKEGEEYAF